MRTNLSWSLQRIGEHLILFRQADRRPQLKPKRTENNLSSLLKEKEVESFSTTSFFSESHHYIYVTWQNVNVFVPLYKMFMHFWSISEYTYIALKQRKNANYKDASLIIQSWVLEPIILSFCWKLCSSKVENSEEKTRRLRIRSSAEFLYSMTCVVICSHRRSPLSHFYRVSYRYFWRRDS